MSDEEIDSVLYHLCTRRPQNNDERDSEFSDASTEDDNHRSDIEDPYSDDSEKEEIDVEELEIDQDLVVEPGKKRRRTSYIYGKGKKGSAHRFKWTKDPPETNDRRNSSSTNVDIITPCCLENASTVKTPVEAWELLFSENLLNIILTHTNEEI